ncbi:MAG: hypothetical protein ABIK83_15985 [Candidatus Zixiibacteriota bacterium]
MALLVISGCGSVRTRTGFYDPITVDLKKGEYEAAVAGVEAAKESNKYEHKDRFVYFIDAGMANHFAGNFDSSNARLTLAESSAEDLFTKSISRAAASMLLNDNVLEYAGEDYEILYTNIIMALNYLMLGNYDDAFVEVRRANLKLDLLDQKYASAAEKLQRGSPDDTARIEVDYNVEKVRFHNDAFARYLSMHMYAAGGKWDDARIDYDYLRDAFKSQPHVYNFEMPEVTYNPQGDGVILSVIGMAGLSPVKEAFDLRIRTDKDLDLVQVLYTDSENNESEYGHLPIDIGEDFYFKFSIPRIVERPSTVDRIRVFAGPQTIGELQLIEDVYRVADETFRAKSSLIYIRSVVRAVSKGLSAHLMKKEVDTGGFEGWLKKAAVDVATEISEGADLRCSHLLPGRIYVGDFELEPGVYDLRIEFIDKAGNLICAEELPGYEVRSNGLNIVRALTLN